MKNYKWAKIFIITTAVLSCCIVLLTFLLAYFRQIEIIRPNALVTEELIESSTSVAVEYKSESITFEDKDDVKKIAEKFLQTELKPIVTECEMKGKIIFYTTHPDTGDDTTVEIGFDEKLENIQLNGKMYTGERLLSFKNLLVTLTNDDKNSENTEETTDETTTETTTAETTETTTEKETAFYSTQTQRFDWGGSAAYFEVAKSCENYDAIVDDGEKNFPVVKITSREELESFAQSVNKYFALNINKYDAEHFTENEMYIIYADEKPSSNNYDVEKVSIDGEKLDIIMTYTGTTGTDLGSRFVFMSIEKDAVDGCTEYNAYMK